MGWSLVIGTVFGRFFVTQACVHVTYKYRLLFYFQSVHLLFSLLIALARGCGQMILTEVWAEFCLVFSLIQVCLLVCYNSLYQVKGFVFTPSVSRVFTFNLMKGTGLKFLCVFMFCLHVRYMCMSDITGGQRGNQIP